ncbi:MAG: DUF4126 domain-containing protein [Gemmatimonadota bacterium]
MDPIERITEISAVAAAAGINPWLAALTLVGLSALDMVDMGTLPFLESELADPAILTALVAAFLLEQVADKIPGVDHVSDLVHLPIKPAAAVGLAMMVAGPDDPARLADYWIPLAVAAAAVALITHLGKAGLRSGSTLATGGMGNPVLSALEDVGVVGLIVLAVLLPIVSLALVALVLWLSVRGIAKLLRRLPVPLSTT